MRLRTILLLGSLLSITVANLTLGVEAAYELDEGPSRESIEQAQRKRRDDLRSLEESTSALRKEIIEQLTDVVAAQDLVIRKAEERHQAARQAREAAEYSVLEYQKSILPQEIETAKGDLALAKEYLDRANQELDASMRRANQVNNDIIIAQLDVQKCELDKSSCEEKLALLINYSGPSEIKRLSAILESTKAKEVKEEQILKIERNKGTSLIEQAKRFKVRSPEDLVIALINDTVQCEERILGLIRDAQTIEAQIREKPAQASTLLLQLRKNREDAQTQMAKAKTQLIEAAILGEETRSRRLQLAEVEARLKKERTIVETSERKFVPAAK